MLKWILPPLVLLFGLIATMGLMKLGPEPETKIPEPVLPSVEYVLAEPSAHTLVVQSQGSVRAAIQSVFLPEVSGRIIRVGANFDAGRFFEEGEVLLELDPLHYRGALAQAEAALASARLSLEQEIAQGQQAAQEWKELGRGEPSDLTLRKPQQALARAQIQAAETALEIARENLARTKVRAPFRGRIRETFVDVGQVVNANQTQLATIYTIDAAEVRLPLSLAELSRLGIDENTLEHEGGPAVTLSAAFGIQTHTWDAVVDRIEGTVDPITRLVYLVARCDDPYNRDADSPGRPNLKVGLFVEASIAGRTLENVFVLPRRVMVREDEIYVVDTENRLHRRVVRVVSSDPEEVVIASGLEAGDRINLTPIDFFIEGMAVQPKAAGSDPSSESEPVAATAETEEAEAA